jgi:anti-sigma B factor antagonist
MNPARSGELQIEISDKGADIRVLRLTGPLTLSTLFDFQEASRRDLSRSIILDLSKVPYMDSAGLGCVISVFTSCQRNQRGFGMIGVPDRIVTLFKVAQVDGLLPSFASEEAAEAAVTASGHPS